jgi:2-polyprenyl-6-methoxyphenol hydroxylase-like FAD-dependent oxidoreductase
MSLHRNEEAHIGAPMELKGQKVIVVGAGLGGSAASVFLARAGACVALFEEVAEPGAIGAGIAMAENGLAVLESLGLGPALQVGRPVTETRITDADGRTLIAAPSPPPRVLMLRRSTLRGILLDALMNEPRVERHFGAEVVRADPDGTVVVREDGVERTLRGDLVIGADGVHSCVRESGAFGGRVRRSGLSYVRMLVDAGLETGTEAWTPGGVFGAFAVDNGTYAFASCGLPDCRAALDARDLSVFRAAWARAYRPADRILGALSSFDDLLVNEVLHVRCVRWFDGRLVLLGDAAHAMAPNLGQGANSALVDAAVLLDELRRASSLDAALTRYQQRRRAAVNRVAAASARLGQIAEATNPVARTLRDRVLLPIVGLFSTSRGVAMMMQEPSRTLLAIGKAQGTTRPAPSFAPSKS